jgi:hypothetical protein
MTARKAKAKDEAPVELSTTMAVRNHTSNAVGGGVGVGMVQPGQIVTVSNACGAGLVNTGQFEKVGPSSD